MSIPKSLLDDPFLTAKHIMEVLPDMPRATVYHKIRWEMKRYKFGRRVYVRFSDFQKWLESQSEEPNR